MEPRLSASKQMRVPPREKRRSTAKPRSSRSWAMISASTVPSTSCLQPMTIGRSCSGAGRRPGEAMRTARTRQMRRRQVRLRMSGPSRLELCLEEVANELVRRRVDNLFPRPVLGDAAAVENDQPLSQLQRFAQVMRNQDDGARLRLLQAQELLLDVVAGDGIEGAERLVEQEKKRLEHHGPAQADTLLLTSG